MAALHLHRDKAMETDGVLNVVLSVIDGNAPEALVGIFNPCLMDEPVVSCVCLLYTLHTAGKFVYRILFQQLYVHLNQNGGLFHVKIIWPVKPVIYDWVRLSLLVEQLRMLIGFCTCSSMTLKYVTISYENKCSIATYFPSNLIILKFNFIQVSIKFLNIYTS